MSKHYSLRSRLLFWIIGGNIVLWLASGLFVWYEASRDLEVLLVNLLNGNLTAEKFQSERLDLIESLVRDLTWPLAVSLPLMAIGIAIAIHFASRSLTTLSNSLASRSSLSFDPVETQNLPLEVKPVVDQLNRLFERMRDSVEKEQRFTSAAAHELRTPISAMRAQAQVASLSDNLIDQRHALGELMIACDRASHLVNQLLYLARLENENQHLPSQLQTQKFDLNRLLRTMLALATMHAQAKNQSLSLDSDSEDPVFVMGRNEALIGSLLRNLLDNAVRYSPRDAQIEVNIFSKNKQTCIEIADSGPGMSEADITQLGERFFRSQSMEHIDGSGLGWSIVKQIAESEKLNVNVRRAARLGGLCVSVCFSEQSAGKKL
ncbi:MAG TPA: ATP-binding protein [Burkholderiaceae bacterium]|nr:ATP-binding protein [Burkholderiaceae bacterium]